MKEQCELCDMICAIVMCFLQNDKYDDACYSHDFLNMNLTGPLTLLYIIHIVRRDLLLIFHVDGVCLHIPILSTSVY